MARQQQRQQQQQQQDYHRIVARGHYRNCLLKMSLSSAGEHLGYYMLKKLIRQFHGRSDACDSTAGRIEPVNARAVPGKLRGNGRRVPIDFSGTSGA